MKAKDRDGIRPDLQIPADTPPIFLAHASDDGEHHGGSDAEHSVIAYLALKRAGVPAELHVYAGTVHDFGVRKVGKPCDAWTTACADWMRHQGFLGSKK